MKCPYGHYGEVAPCCSSPTCGAEACYRAGCTWRSEPCTGYLVASPGIRMTTYKPVMMVGTFTTAGGVRNWYFETCALPDWPLTELYVMWLHFGQISGLPECRRHRT